MKRRYTQSQVLLVALSVMALVACRASPTGGLLAAEPAAAPAQGVTVTPLDWLRAQTAPDFAPDSTLPPLTRWGWAMSFEVAKELADRWGYAVEFSGYVSEKVADEALANPSGRNGQCLALVAGNPAKYKLGVLVDRQFPKDMPPEAYLRDAQGNFIPDKGNAKSLSPEMPEDCLQQAGRLSAVGLAKLRTRCPIAIIQNGGEYGLNVLGWAQKYLPSAPRSPTACCMSSTPAAETRTGAGPSRPSTTTGRGTTRTCASVRTLPPTSTIITTSTRAGSARTTCSPRPWAPKVMS
ncbi:MAG: hypothetical protein MUF25_29025 [Pirellulaceae bacterium]|nr:hypothetical protein [Pirellulaceae bacterium]